MKTIKTEINFTDEDVEIYQCRVGKKIEDALEKSGVEIHKFRYTYVESQYGIAEMPPALILASFLCDFRDCQAFNHILPTLSGKYTFKFK